MAAFSFKKMKTCYLRLHALYIYICTDLDSSCEKLASRFMISIQVHNGGHCTEGLGAQLVGGMKRLS